MAKEWEKRNVDWTKIGEKNLENISETFHCDVIQLQPNIHAQQILTKKAFEELGQPSWYLDSILYIPTSEIGTVTR